ALAVACASGLRPRPNGRARRTVPHEATVIARPQARATLRALFIEDFLATIVTGGLRRRARRPGARWAPGRPAGRPGPSEWPAGPQRCPSRSLRSRPGRVDAPDPARPGPVAVAPAPTAPRRSCRVA